MAKTAKRREADAEHWEDADLATLVDAGELTETAPPERAPATTFSIRVEPGVVGRLRRLADAQGVGVTQLARRFVVEGLDRAEEAPTADTARIVEAVTADVRASLTRELRRRRRRSDRHLPSGQGDTSSP